MEIDKQIESYRVSWAFYMFRDHKDEDNTIFRVYITKSGGVDLDLCVNLK